LILSSVFRRFAAPLIHLLIHRISLHAFQRLVVLFDLLLCRSNLCATRSIFLRETPASARTAARLILAQRSVRIRTLFIRRSGRARDPGLPPSPSSTTSFASA